MTTQALDRTDDGAGRAFWSDAIFVIAVAFAVFHLYTGAFGLLEGIKQRVIHLGFALVLVFLSRPLSNAKSPRTIDVVLARSEEHTSELQSLMRISYAVFCLKK